MKPSPNGCRNMSAARAPPNGVKGLQAKQPNQASGHCRKSASDRRTEKQPALSFGSTGSGRLVYAKPFVSAPKAIVGGYCDIQYRAHRNGRLRKAYGNGGRRMALISNVSYPSFMQTLLNM